MGYKPVDTAVVMVVGPCVDDTDFKTLEEAIAYNAAGMDVSLIVEKTDGTTAVTAITLTTGGTSDWTHKDGGYYEIEITAAQNIEEGIGFVRGVCTGVLPFESAHYNIVVANIYDSLIKGTDSLQVDAVEISGDSGSADNLELDYDGTGYTKANSVIGTCTTNTDMVGTAGANTVTPDIAGTAATLHGVTDGLVTTVDGVVDDILTDTDELQGNQGNWLTATSVTVSDKTGFSLSTAGIKAMWDQLTSALTTASTIGKLLVDNIDATISSRNSVTPDAVGTAPTAAEINAEMVDVMTIDTTSEMSQGPPPETPTFQEMWAYIYFRMRNKCITTSTADSIYDNAGTTVLFKATISDDGSEFVKEEYVDGST